MAAHPIAAYKKMGIMMNGVMKNVIIPVRSPSSRDNLKPASQIDNDDDGDECFVVEERTIDLSESPARASEESELDDLVVEPVEIAPCDNEPDCEITDDLSVSPEKLVASIEASETVSSSGSSQLLCQQSYTQKFDDIVEPVEISPCDDEPDCDITDVTISYITEKLVGSAGMPISAENSVTDTHTTVAACSDPRSTSNIIMPACLNCSASNGTVQTTEAVVLSETQPPPFASATVVQNIVANTSRVDNAAYHDEQPQSFRSLTSAMPSADPVLTAPLPVTKVSSLSYILSPRTMTKEEAVAAGWFTEEPAVENFVSSVELVSLETDNDIKGISTSSALGTDNHKDIIPVMSRSEERPDSYASCLMGACGSSENHLSGKHQLQMDVTIDRKAHLIVNETERRLKLENLVSDGYDYGRLMSEEDEPLTAVIEGLDSDNVSDGAAANSNTVKSENTATVHRRRGRPAKFRSPGSRHVTGASGSLGNPLSANSNTVKSENTEPVRRRRGRPPKLRLPSSSHATVKNWVKRTAAHTAANRRRLRDCGVYLQQLRLSSATVNIHRAWKYLCCREPIPRFTGSCCLCRGRRISQSVTELAAARTFRSGSRQFAEAKNLWQEFSLDSDLLPLPSASPASSESKKTPSKTAPTSDSGPPSQEDKKYLIIQTETGTFVVSVESAVGCIVSEREITQMLSSQTLPSSTSYAGEFSNETLLAVCSQMEQSSSHKTASSDEVRNMAASAAGRSTSKKPRGRPRGRRKSTLPLAHRRKTQPRLRSVTNTRALNRISTTRRLSADLVCRARRSLGIGTMKRELRGLGIIGRSPRLQNRTRCKRIR